MMRMAAISIVALVTIPASHGADAPEKVTGTITRVDATARTLAIAPEAKGRAAVDLDVSRKAKVTVEGAEAGIDSLRAASGPRSPSTPASGSPRPSRRPAGARPPRRSPTWPRSTPAGGTTRRGSRRTA